MVQARAQEIVPSPRPARRPLPRPDARPVVAPASSAAVPVARLPATVPASDRSARASDRSAPAMVRAPAQPLPRVEATPAPEKVSTRTLRVLRAYEDEDLMAIAEIGYHYLMSGALDLARIVFDGLHAIAPDEAYFALALGLVRDREGDKTGAAELYTRAGRLDPEDARPDVNRAELHIERGEVAEARRLLERARTKAIRSEDGRLEQKIEAVLRHLALGAVSDAPARGGAMIGRGR